MKIGINGFGRIGRALLRAILDSKLDIRVVGINDPGSTDTLCHLLKYDSVHGQLKHHVSVDGEHLVVGEHRIRLSHHRDPSLCDWQGVDWLMECSGKLTDRPSLINLQQRAGQYWFLLQLQKILI